MSFWKKLFGKKQEKNTNSLNVVYEKYRDELNELNLTTSTDLENLLRPLIKPATKLVLHPVTGPPENSQFESHFGGQPYFETGEKWPESKSGKPLDFIFQVFNAPGLEMPDSIALLQLFYDWDELPWETENDGWKVKLYKTIDKDQVVDIKKPKELSPSKFCKIEFMSSQTLPSWEGIETVSELASKLSCVLNYDKPWDIYEEVMVKLIGEQNYQSQLGGHPKWVQGESNPVDKKGNPIPLLFQIDSEEKADLMWGDLGLIYVFYDEKTEKIEFSLQCY